MFTLATYPLGPLGDIRLVGHAMSTLVYVIYTEVTLARGGAGRATYGMAMAGVCTLACVLPTRRAPAIEDGSTGQQLVRSLMT